MKAIVWLMGLICLACSTTTYNKGVVNLVQVDACVWRSGQETTNEQWQTIKSLGTTSIAKLNFENEGSDDGARQLGIDVHDFSIEPRGDLDFVIDSILHTLIHPDRTVVAAADAYIATFYPVPFDGGFACPSGILLIHCTHGQDRTGYFIGRYRVLSYHWTKQQAFDEMIANGFHTSLHGIYDEWSDWQP